MPRTLLCLLFAMGFSASGESLSFPFHPEGETWSIGSDLTGLRVASHASWRRGGHGLVVDPPRNQTQTLRSEARPLPPGGHYRLDGWMRSFRGDSLRVAAVAGEETLAELRLDASMTGWTRVLTDFEAAPGTELRLEIMADTREAALSAEVDALEIHASDKAFPAVTDPGDLAALAPPLDLNQTQMLFIQRRTGHTGPAWTSMFPQSAEDEDLLTDADVVGPDGRVYPDFRYAGVPGGIPEEEVLVRAADFGVHPDAETPVTDGLRRALAAAAEQGGGAVLLEPGVYELDAPLVIRTDGVVLRGAGCGETILRFTYNGPGENGVGFANAVHGSEVGPGNRLILHAKTVALDHMRIRGPDGHVLAEHGRDRPEWYFYQEQNRPANFTVEVRGNVLLDRYGEGSHVFTAEAVRGGQTETHELEVELVRSGGNLPAWEPSAISVMGRGTWNQERTALAEPAVRGARVIRVTRPEIFADAAYLVLSVRGPEDWFQKYMVEHPVARGGWLRRVVVGIERVEGDRVVLKQPLRIPWNPAEGVLVIPWQPVRGVGIEALTLEQTGEKWTSGISFRAAAESWVRNVRVIRPGRNPVDTWDVKHIEVRDAEFDGARYTRGGGGTAYVAWQAAYDCLMTGVRARGLRHAPNVQWSSSGNVFRDSEFEDSGGQWHAGYATENLYENLRINSTGREGSYAFALFSSIPNGMHGPQGPRNVVRNCTVSSHRGGIKLGGFNEGWIFTHNRILARNGPALVILPGAQNLVFAENTFTTLNPDPAPVWIATADCVGVEMEGNTFIGVGQGPVFAGGGTPARVENQTVVAGLLPPTDIPSLHDWQRDLPAPEPMEISFDEEEEENGDLIEDEDGEAGEED